ncbi:MAG: alginate export family protein [Elusimicrobiaceae bacterium]
MKKLLGLAMVGMLVASAIPAKAEIFKNLQTKGELEVYGVMTHNVTDLNSSLGDDYRNTYNRITYGAAFDMLDDLHANLTFVKNDRMWGENAQAISGAAGNSILENIYLQEANIVLDDLFGLKAKIGRSFYGNEGDIIVYYGNQHMVDGLPTSSVDLASFVREDSIKGMDNAFELTYAKTLAAAAPLQDTGANFWAVKDVLRFNSDMDMGLFIYNQRTGNNSPVIDGQNLWVLDLNHHGKAMGFNWGAELAMNLGTWDKATQPTRNYKGWAAKLDIAYEAKVQNIGLTPRFMFAYGSGDNQGANGGGQSDKNFRALNPNFQPGYIFGKSNGNFASAVPGVQPWTDNSLSNLQVWNLGVDVDVTEKLSFIVDGYNFWVNSLAAGSFGGNRHIGAELDLTGNYAYAKNVDLGLYAAKFYPGGLLANANNGAINSSYKIGSYVSVRF